jgi:peptidoglycan hydrolase CwlO-like protein
LARIRARLQRALEVLRKRLVAIYEAGSPDVVSVVLESETWSQVSARAEYLSQIQEYDNSVADRVKGLRDEAKAAVARMAAIRAQLKEARDAIAVKEREGRGGEGRGRGALRRAEGGAGGAPGSAR